MCVQLLCCQEGAGCWYCAIITKLTSAHGDTVVKLCGIANTRYTLGSLGHNWGFTVILCWVFSFISVYTKFSVIIELF